MPAPTWLGGRPRRKPWRHLRPGGFYRIARDVCDHDGRLHRAGGRLRYVTHGFLPAEDGLSLVFVTDRGEDLAIRLQDRPEAQAGVIGALDRIIVPCETPARSAFAGLRSVTDAGLVSFDGIDRDRFGWSRITRVTAAQGRQQYDATCCVTIDRGLGPPSIFLPETEPLWAPFLDLLETRLSPVLPRSAWLETVAADPHAHVTLYRRGLLAWLVRGAGAGRRPG